MIPTLETERLVLRPMTMDDWPAYERLMASERARFMDGPHAQSATWGMFCHDIALWHLGGHGALMIEDRASGYCVGQIGINHGPLFPEYEIGWFVYEEAEGRGYAFEAAKVLRDWGKDVRRLPTLVSYIDPVNHRSISVAERLGAKLDPDAPRNASNDLVYRHFG